ncbi:hypothetical protein TrST_g4812 [Triparma strigata]|uniref:15-cis-phytoene synthase n=1 Tax=Triparma strigata TaxID=1606541 RepID=A0A9W7EQ07_9STRA|nr:hypothetical protein TrST_g4812 [Triparma strigata]
MKLLQLVLTIIYVNGFNLSPTFTTCKHTTSTSNKHVDSRLYSSPPSGAMSPPPKPSSPTASSPPSASSPSSPTHSSGRTAADISHELSLGTSLTSPSSSLPTIDFSGVSTSGSSKAESALNSAKLKYKKSVTPYVQNTRIMGINDDVVSAVGREVGSTLPPSLVSELGSYIRSQSSLFPTKKATHNPSLSETYSANLRKIYVESGDITSAFAKTFHLGTTLMPQSSREAIWAIYVWCRRTDEIVDAPRTPDDNTMLQDLSEWSERLERLWYDGVVVDPLDLALLDVRCKYQELSIEPFEDMIKGMLMDIPDLGQDRYSSFEELHLYCYRVAGTVGLMSTPIFGVGEEYNVEEAKEPALSLGVAFQITNILRDVGEDADRGRIYIPKEDMDRFGVTEEQIFGKVLDDNYVEMMKFQIERARAYYVKARRGVRMLSPEARLPVQASLDCYSEILTKIEENGYDNLGKRAYLSKEEKLMTLPASWYRTQDISQLLPLWGDEKVIM